MDMEVIQEFSENQSYLNALQTANMDHKIVLTLPDVDEKALANMRSSENVVRVLSQPMGRFFFRMFLRESNCLELLLFLDSIDEYDTIPSEKYRARVARRIVQSFLSPNSRQEIPVSVHIREAISTRLALEGPAEDLFEGVRSHVYEYIELSVFETFLYSKLYQRFHCFCTKDSAIVSYDEFTFLRVLGEGGFGKVYAIMKNDTQTLYACKAMSKLKIMQKKREKLIMNERNILARVDHPFIVSMQYSFQDERNLYIVMDLLSGGELGFHLHRFGKFSEDMVRFYAAGIVLAIEYFHSVGMVYRDLKPENVLLDADGYIKLTDLGLCSFIKDDEFLHQHCGTRSYMAPEQCYGLQGYSQTVDWWALGITCFHLMTGVNPFSRRYRRRRRRDREQKEREAPSLGAISRGSSTKHYHRSARTYGLNSNTEFRKKPSKGRIRLQHLALGDNMDGKDAAKDASDKQKDDLAVDSPLIVAEEGDDVGDDNLALGGRDSSPIPKNGKKPEANGRRRETPEARAERYAQLDQLYRDTLKEWPWPEGMSSDARSLCEGLIKLSPKERLGSNGAAEIKAHPFFKGIDFDKLRARHITPPFVPDRDYVNAKFLESASAGFMNEPPVTVNDFAYFDYNRPMVFQEEIMRVAHDKDLLLGTTPLETKGKKTN